MNRIEQVKDFIDPNSPFKIKYIYEIDDVPKEYCDFVFETLLSDFKLELKAKIYKVDKEILMNNTL